MLSKKKKIIILSSMLVLLVVTGWLNIALNNKGKDVNAGVTAGNLFSTYRADRIATRTQTMLNLDAIIANASTTSEAKAEATNQKLELTKAMEVELVLEGLIKAKEGFEDCIVTVSTENINVIVKCEEMTDQLKSQIIGIVRSETDKSARNIRIIPVE